MSTDTIVEDTVTQSWKRYVIVFEPHDARVRMTGTLNDQPVITPQNELRREFVVNAPNRYRAVDRGWDRLREVEGPDAKSRWWVYSVVGRPIHSRPR